METNPTDPNELLTPSEVAKMLRCNRRTIVRYTTLELNPLKAEKHSQRRWMFRRSDVESFRNKSRQG